MTRLGDALLWVACHPLLAFAAVASFVGTCIAIVGYCETRELMEEP